MKRLFITMFCLSSLTLASMPAFGQGRGGGHAGGFGGGAGGPGFGGPSSNVGFPRNGAGAEQEHGAAANPHSGSVQQEDRAHQQQDHAQHTQQPLKDSQINGGAFKMLEQKTGMSQAQLQSLYQSSGAKNFGEFTSAVVVSKNIGLDTNAVLNGLKTQSLGQTLKDLGVSSDKAKEEIKKAKNEVKQTS